ncbi:ferritin-like domain-containing protein [Piscinibacter sp. XHJ-5]|uniref:ferritin-like domain-containing protein n=1 Tax=Piscinibacter sp. XHJ-5 TaxID=3037797 RepID=UPI002452FA20|nr:ferritin-like domain-containing protein [Piscinibacter sp. XHJ-5]
MQPTSLGPNLTGAAKSPAALKAMKQAAEALTPFIQIDTSGMEAQKLAFIAEAEAVGSVPSPVSLKGVVKAGVAQLKGGQPTIFLDKIGERLAYERAGVRLYDALILKYHAAQQAGGVLPPVTLLLEEDAPALTEDPAETLERIRGEEFEHFNLLCDAMTTMGGDPTAQTPCADVTAVASSGFMQVLNDPRTTLAQCLNAMLAVELADNAGWEMLATLADQAGQSDLAGRFLGALGQEQEHLTIIKAWLTAVVHDESRSSAA